MSDTPCPTCGQLRPRGTRFFARVKAAVLECPRCGWMLDVSIVGKGRRTSRNPWDARSSTIRCPGCQSSFVLGLIAWPIAWGTWDRALPRDQVPTLEQARELTRLRNQASGVWLEETKPPQRADETNLTGKVCTCPEHRISLTCPIHGLEGETIDPDTMAYLTGKR